MRISGVRRKKKKSRNKELFATVFNTALAII